MTKAELQAWLDGFLTGRISDEDMERVREKVARLQPEVIRLPPEPVAPQPYIPDTCPPYRPYTGEPYPGLYPTITCERIDWGETKIALA